MLLTITVTLALGAAAATPTDKDKAAKGKAPAAPAKAAPAAKPVATTNAIPPELPVPQSVFVSPTKVSEGRDPFYPASMRPYHLPAAPSAAPVQVVHDLQLKGISVVNGLRLAVINNATLKEGEDGEVMTSSGRVRVSCLEIKVDTALVQIGSERRLLKLRSGA